MEEFASYRIVEEGDARGFCGHDGLRSAMRFRVPRTNSTLARIAIAVQTEPGR